MGSKSIPGLFDCYAAAEADEPMFVLLARDRHAPSIVRQWADRREFEGEDPKKVAEARKCADEMEAWNRKRLAPWRVKQPVRRAGLRR